MNEHSFTGENAPGFWMYETSGVLRPAVEAYLNHEAMTGEQIVAMRAYLRQWIMAPVWDGSGIDSLRAKVGKIASREDINAWLEAAMEEGIDPL